MMNGIAISTTLITRGRGASAFDPDAAAYISAVETADGEALEEGVKTAINDFVVGCKADSIWAALKSACILAGARTLSGALVPLVGTAPTNVNFVSGDYDRKTGPKGNGSTKYLNSNRANNADPQNSNHNAVWVSEFGTKNAVLMGASFGSDSNNMVDFAGGGPSFNANIRSAIVAGGSVTKGLGFFSTNRAVSTSYSVRANGSTTTFSTSSDAPAAENLFVFARNDGGPIAHSDARLSFYSIGESIDLAALDARVSALMAALDGAIA